MNFAAMMERCADITGAAYDSFAKAEGLSSKVFEIICVLWDNPSGVTQKEICNRTWLPKQTVSTKTLALIEDGTAMLLPNPSDGRSNLVALTDEGKTRYRPMFERLAQCEEQATLTLTAQEQQLIVNGSFRWVEAFNKAAADLQRP